MTAKQDVAREANVQPSGDHELRAFKTFRESYVTFMDECSRIWHFHCHRAAEVAKLAHDRVAAAGTSPSAETLTSIQNEVADAFRGHQDQLRGELQRAVHAYAKGNAAGWAAAGDQKDHEWLMWHVGVGQMNAAAACSTLLRALGS